MASETFDCVVVDASVAPEALREMLRGRSGVVVATEPAAGHEELRRVVSDLEAAGESTLRVMSAPPGASDYAALSAWIGAEVFPVVHAARSSGARVALDALCSPWRFATSSAPRWTCATEVIGRYARAPG